MNTVIFEKLLEYRLKKIQNVLSKKALEYVQNEDRLHNFRVGARIGNETMEKTLEGMMRKHLISVLDLIEDPENATLEMVDEKLGDLINYLILLEAIFFERLKMQSIGK